MYRVYHAMRESGADFIVPPPPPAVVDNPNVRHGVIDRPDPHRVDDKARLLAQIEMDQGRTNPTQIPEGSIEFFDRITLPHGCQIAFVNFLDCTIGIYHLAES